MKEPYDEGVANHIGPESCGGASNATAEALTGVRAGRVLSREILLFQGADGMGQSEGNTGCVAIARHRGPCAVEDLGTYGNTLTGTGRSYVRPWRGNKGRVGKSKDVIQ
jgi:hypothetical protein